MEVRMGVGSSSGRGKDWTGQSRAEQEVILQDKSGETNTGETGRARTESPIEGARISRSGRGS
eukprot:765034-Hanusia_phi.AAC.1